MTVRRSTGWWALAFIALLLLLPGPIGPARAGDTGPCAGNSCSITFTETGLPSGTFWSVALNGTPGTNSSTTNTIGFNVMNATYTFTVGVVPGYVPDTSSGQITIDGTNYSETIHFTQAEYTVSFPETGLPSGTSWSVDLDGTTHTSTASTITFSEPNGSYSFSIPGVTGYTPSPSSGSVQVNGGPTSQSIVWAQALYTVSFNENGLPPGTTWSVTLDGTTHSSSSGTITFQKPNGSFSFTVPGVAGYSPSPSSGSVTVNGGPASETITWSQALYTVTFSESGLPTGTSWSVDLDGTTHSSSSTTITFQEANGTYSFSILVVSGYSPSPSSGSVTVNGGPASQAITWSQVLYTVTFSESGLPSGTLWSVLFGGNTHSSSSATITFDKPNGTFSFTVLAVSGYSPSPSSGSITVDGAPASQTITWSQVFYTVTFEESGLPSGTSWSVDLVGTTHSSTSTTITFQEANGTFSFSVLEVPGYFPSPVTGSVTVDGGPFTQPISWSRVNYAVWFNETGLPTNTSWSVKLNGGVISSNTSSILGSEPNGTYSYVIQIVSGFEPTVRSGSLTVNGESVSITVLFLQVTYTVSFEEEGLPANKTWTVWVDEASTNESSKTPVITFNEPNGTHNFTVTTGYPGYAPYPPGGPFTVDGKSMQILITFSNVLYHVEFAESGLSSGTLWSVTLDGVTNRSTTSTIGFNEPNGSYTFLLPPVRGYELNISGGTERVSGAAVQVSVGFFPYKYPVDFVPSGIPRVPAQNWSVILTGLNQSNLGIYSILFTEPNGTYTFSVDSPPYYKVASITVSTNLSNTTYGVSSGSFSVKGNPLYINITFTNVTEYAVDFVESGLSGGTAWEVTAWTSSVTSYSGTVTLTLPDGTWSYYIAYVPGYVQDSPSGTVKVNGTAVTIPVVFHPVGGVVGGPPKGLSDLDLAAIGVGLTLAALFGVLLYQRLRGRNQRPAR